jgi:RNA polymerase sigma-70 factor (ECF subfamily)
MMSHVLTMDGMGAMGRESLLEGRERKAPKTRRPAQPKIQAKTQAGTPVRPDQAAKNAAKNAGDLALATALTGGERGAWNHFVRQFAGVVYAAVQRRLIPAGRGDEVEDVVQEVYVRLCKADFRLLRSYDPARARLSTWLTVVATSASIDYLRRQRMAKIAIEDAPESCLAVEDPVFENIKIPDGLLSGRQALVLELLYKRDLEVADAAGIMKIDPQTVRSTHHKALTKLRAHFREIGELPG